MLNSLDAHEGNDFEYLPTSDIKNKLAPSLAAFWEVVEANQMDIIKADGHPLGKTFKFYIHVTNNKHYKDFFQRVKAEPLYEDYSITIDERKPFEEILVTFELTNINNR